jgi:hypothetical protein
MSREMMEKPESREMPREMREYFSICQELVTSPELAQELLPKLSIMADKLYDNDGDFKALYDEEAKRVSGEADIDTMQIQLAALERYAQQFETLAA